MGKSCADVGELSRIDYRQDGYTDCATRHSVPRGVRYNFDAIYWLGGVREIGQGLIRPIYSDDTLPSERTEKENLSILERFVKFDLSKLIDYKIEADISHLRGVRFSLLSFDKYSRLT